MSEDVDVSESGAAGPQGAVELRERIRAIQGELEVEVDFPADVVEAAEARGFERRGCPTSTVPTSRS